MTCTFGEMVSNCVYAVRQISVKARPGQQGAVLLKVPVRLGTDYFTDGR
jgi:hypothetical protein